LLIVQNENDFWREIRRRDTWRYLSAVWGTTADNVFAVGGSDSPDRGSIGLHYDGAQWKEVPDLSVPGYCLSAVGGSSGTDIYAVGTTGYAAGASGRGKESGLLLHYDGETWTNIGTPMGYGAVSLWVAGPSSVYLPLGTDGIWHWDGEQWTKASDIDASYLWGYVHSSGERR
jgi:hypothetical protein